MHTSETLVKFAPAFLLAQRAITFAAKDATNPHFRNKYADLPAVIEAVKPALNAAGIAFTQTPAPSEPGTLALCTRLQHESGEFIEDTCTLPLPKADPQGYGSAMTYARRYALAAICGLFQDDDDGNAASATPATAKPAKSQGNALSGPISDKTRDALVNLMEKSPHANARIEAALKAFKVTSIDGFTEEQGQKVFVKISAEILQKPAA